jgi:hypothetical protein
MEETLIMFDEKSSMLSDETHDQFVKRASAVFPPDRAQHWSRIERAVFNHLMTRLIHNRGYAAITDQMLLDSRADMEKMLGRCRYAPADQTDVAISPPA